MQRLTLSVADSNTEQTIRQLKRDWHDLMRTFNSLSDDVKKLEQLSKDREKQCEEMKRLVADCATLQQNIQVLQSNRNKLIQELT
jgi:SMC interacting uncharacterized protein involved in chromosome segregation